MKIDIDKVRKIHETDGIITNFFDEDYAVAYMLVHGILMLGSGKYIEDERYDIEMSLEPETTLILVDCSDLFAWGCCDYQEVPRDKLADLFDMWYGDRRWGSDKWCCEQRNQKPQEAVVDVMKEAGVWDDIMENLQENEND